MKITRRLIHKILCLATVFCVVLIPVEAGTGGQTPFDSVACPEDSSAAVRPADTTVVRLPSDSVFARYLQHQGYVITPHNELTLLTSGRSTVSYTHLTLPTIA